MPTTAPAPAQGTLNQLLATIGNVTDMAKETAEQIDAAKALVDTKASEVEVQRAATVKAQQQVTTMKQDSDATIVNMLGLDPTTANAILPKLLAERSALADEQTALYQEIREKQSTGFLDDPLGWIVNRYTLSDTIDEHNTVVDRRNTITNNIEALVTVADAAEKANWAGIAATNATVRKAELDSIAFAALQKSMEATEKLAKFNIDALGHGLQARGKVAEMQQAALVARNSQEALSMARAREKREITLFEQQQDDQKDWQAMAKGMSTRFYNGAAISVPMMKRMYMEPGAEGQAVRALAKAVITNSSVGGSPGEAFVALRNQNINLADGEQALVLDRSNKIVEEAIKKASPAGDLITWKKLGSEEKAAVMDKVINDTITKKIKSNTYVVDKNSIYAAPSIANLLLAVPDLAKMPLWESLKQLPPNTQLDYNQVRQIGINLVLGNKYGEIDSGAVERMVTDINDTYKAVNKYTATKRGLRTVFGLPELVNYHNIATGAGLLDPRSNTVNTISKADITRDIISELLRIKSVDDVPDSLLEFNN